MNNNNNKQGKKKYKKLFIRHKICRFCTDENLIIDYKEPKTLRHYVTEQGKIIPRRITGTCAKHQRKLTREIKRSRAIALMPYVGSMAN